MRLRRWSWHWSGQWGPLKSSRGLALSALITEKNGRICSSPYDFWYSLKLGHFSFVLTLSDLAESSTYQKLETLAKRSKRRSASASANNSLRIKSHLLGKRIWLEATRGLLPSAACVVLEEAASAHNSSVETDNLWCNWSTPEFAGVRGQLAFFPWKIWTVKSCKPVPATTESEAAPLYNFYNRWNRTTKRILHSLMFVDKLAQRIRCSPNLSICGKSCSESSHDTNQTQTASTAWQTRHWIWSWCLLMPCTFALGSSPFWPKSQSLLRNLFGHAQRSFSTKTASSVRCRLQASG